MPAATSTQWLLRHAAARALRPAGGALCTTDFVPRHEGGPFRISPVSRRLVIDATFFRVST
jgi:hypothetical protein